MSPGTTSTQKDASLPAQLDQNALVDDDAVIGEPARDEPTDVVTTAAAAPDASDAAASADAPGDAAPREPGRVRRAGGWVRGHLNAVLAALVIVGLLTGLVLTLLALRHEHALDSARASALTAGQESAIALSSYDYRSLDKDFAAVTDRSTPDFRKSFTQTSDSLKKVLTQYNATAKSTVVASGVTSSSEKHAVVLVFINQTATNTNQKAGPTTDQSRVQVTLSRSGSRWLIEGVKLL